jgi:aryl-alcohol dehydrogenase-like predicted oxidoreductase
MITEAIKICENLNLEPPVADQCEYNCLKREIVEKDYRRLFERFGYGTTVWSPLCGGILTGKYTDGTIPEGTRYESPLFKAISWDKYMGEHVLDKTLEIIKGLKEYSEEIGYTMAQLVLAWAIVNKDVSTCLMGASKMSQLESNLGALNLASSWTEEHENRMTEILKNEPLPRTNFDKFCPDTKRRGLMVAFGIELGRLQR